MRTPEEIKELSEKTLSCMQSGDLPCLEQTINTISDQRDYQAFISSLSENAAALPNLSFKNSDDGRYESLSIPAQNGINVKFDSGASHYPDDDKLTIVDDRVKEKPKEPTLWESLKKRFSSDSEKPAPVVPEVADGFQNIVNKHRQQIEDATK